MSWPKTCVCILRSLDDPKRYYTGVTGNPDARLAAHNAGRSPHTAARGPWELDVVIESSDQARALAFERYLKSGSGVAFAKRHLRRVALPVLCRDRAMGVVATLREFVTTRRLGMTSVAFAARLADLDYSLRNASVGSMRRPRRAGPSDARTPTSSMKTAAPGRMPGMVRPPICSIGTYRPAT